MLKKKTINIVLDSAQHTWKKRPSEIRGYQRTYYITTEDGDYLRLDYSLKEKRVRLYMEIDSEGGNAYYSVITNGKITAERSVSTGRNFGFSDKFRERADIFASIPNREALKLINRNYGIQRGKSAPPEKEKPKTEKEKLIEETKQRYFKREFYPSEGADEERGRKLFKRVTLLDLIDFLIGVLISGSVFLFFKYSYMAMGATAAFFGIIIGFVDMFFRDRSPIFAKVVFFLFVGAASYIYGYFF
ncbi:MAG: hypothetical protein A2176_03030 [Spirochaetes bacterium RBG_13_51_14]|nr:MAG: hypothetical protein A2176_03030 [Spirochaetes bacterium RBG_13_51_14]